MYEEEIERGGRGAVPLGRIVADTSQPLRHTCDGQLGAPLCTNCRASA